MNKFPADENSIVLKMFAFAVNTPRYCQRFQKNVNFPLTNQLFKSSTSIGANTKEGQNAEQENIVCSSTHFQIFKFLS